MGKDLELLRRALVDGSEILVLERHEDLGQLELPRLLCVVVLKREKSTTEYRSITNIGTHIVGKQMKTSILIPLTAVMSAKQVEDVMYDWNMTPYRLGPT